MGEARRRLMNETDPSKPVTRPPIGPYVDKATLTKAGFVEAPSSCFTMTPMTISELWDREKANLRRGFHGRQADLSPYLVLAQCEAEALRGLEQTDLARAANVGVNSVNRFETGRDARISTVEKLRWTLEVAGVAFIAENGGGVGVRFREPKVKKQTET